MMARRLILPAVACVLAGCTSSGTLAPSRANPSPAIVEHGRALLRSSKTHAVAVVLLTPQYEARMSALPAFLVVAANGGETPLPFSPGNVRAFSGDTEVKLYTYRELAWRINLAAERQAETIGENAAADFMEAHSSQVAQSHTFDLPAITTGRFQPTTATPVVDPALATVALNQMVKTSQGVAESITAPQLDQLEGLLRENVIEPGQRAGGMVKLHPEDIKSGLPLKLVVSIGDEKHEFLFDAGK